MTPRGVRWALTIVVLVAIGLAWIVLDRRRTPTAIAWDYPADAAAGVTFFVCLEAAPCRDVGRPAWPAGGRTSYRVELTRAERVQYRAGRPLHVRACVAATKACAETTITKATR
jgi:hypothetical protein